MQKYSKLFGKTSREITSDVVVTSHKLLLQGGFIRQNVAGRYSFLPLGLRVRAKVQEIIRQEMNASNAQEIVSPVLQQLSLWQETKRDKAVNFELMKIEDRRGEVFVLGGTAEEMIVDLVRKSQISYKELPFILYQFSNKFRDEARAYGGLLRVREFLMKDGYSFDKDKEGFEASYKLMEETYHRIYKRCGLQVHAVQSSGGVMGDYKSTEFQVEFAGGEGKYFISEDGQYMAHEDVAEFQRDKKNIAEEMKDMQIIDVERGNSVKEGCRVHGNEAWQHIKNVIYKVQLHDYSSYRNKDKDFHFVHVVIRGDLDINEDKLQKVLNSTTLELASNEEVIQLGYVPGFISPCKTFSDIILGDTSVQTIHNAVTGGDALNKDRINVNYGRDYSFPILHDMATAYEGAESLYNGKLLLKRGTEVGQIFELRYKYSQAMNATYTDETGNPQVYHMGCYGIGIERTLQMIVETNHDEKGIIWPSSVAPFDVHLITLGETEELLTYTQRIVTLLEKHKYEVLWDDRIDVSAGIRFKDADLIGIPVRMVISEKSLASKGVEVKRRNSQELSIIPVDIANESVNILNAIQ